MSPSVSSTQSEATLENEFLRVTVLSAGGQIAELFDKRSGINPLWTPQWRGSEMKRIAPQWSNPTTAFLNRVGGHYLCLDLFGDPSPHEARAGLGTHGEACVTEHELRTEDDAIVASATLPLSQLKVVRRISLERAKESLLINETIENLAAFDRPIAWTQHVTLGSPFLKPNETQLFFKALRSRTHDRDTFPDSPLLPSHDFNWPTLAARDGSLHDLSVFSALQRSCSFSAHLIGAGNSLAAFAVYSPWSKILFGYTWNAQEFPWLSVWEENCSRLEPPWDGRTQAWGLEFGASPFPLTRREMVNRGMLFDTPVFCWLGGRQSMTTSFRASILQIDSIPESVDDVMAMLCK